MSTLIILTTCLLVGATTDGGRVAEVRSLLASKCYACHGPDASGRQADLRLDTMEGQRSHRRAGAPVVPGDPANSLLLQRITHDDIDIRMPAEAPPLEEEEVTLLQDWIEAGASWPTHWAWKPIDNPAVPVVNNTNWIRDPLDAFVLAQLESEELAPAAQAEPTTWLRRVHFDLLGLPPSPTIIETFEADYEIDPEGARERLVDTLLASPHFGEQWGRHWLDLVRYAETCGHEFDYPIPHAWRYRDWVVRAFNNNVTYDRFVIEQIAGDLVTSPRMDGATGLDDSLPGTGFWFFSQGTHAPVDVRQDEADRIENQLDVFGKTFTGLTISCARCHDHKFDPIRTDEYYALAGYLQSSRRRDAYLDPGGRIEARLQELDQARRKIVQSIVTPDHTRSEDLPTEETTTLLESFDQSGEDWFSDGQAFDAPLQADQAYLQDDMLHIAGSGQWHSGLRSPRAQGALRSPSFTIENDWLHHRVKGRGARIRVIIDGFRLNEYNPLLFEDCLKQIDNEDWHHVAQQVGKYRGHVAWIEYSDDGDGWIAIDEIHGSDDASEPSWLGDVDPAVPEHDAERLNAAMESIRDDEASLEAPVRVLAITDGTPEEQVVYLRGNHETPGPIAYRGSPSIMRSPTEVPASGSGRLELAQSLVSARNPLTARVMANRVWHHLMGRGLVESVDDFGAMGRAPTHLDLLDHLATRFRSDWSVKDLVRVIVLSNTYAMSSSANPHSLLIDPENRLLHYRPMKRLTAESIRDSMLASSGRLDPTVGGPPVAIHLSDHMTGRGRPGTSGPLDGNGRRSLYLEVRRNFLPPLLTTFDMPTPATTAGKRNNSNVPAQSLALMNDPFVHEQAQRWADRILIEHDVDEARIHTMFLEAFGRPPTINEQALALEFVSDSTESGPDDTRWADLGHALFNTKEFIYLD
ncbi:MAG: PSD1 and planctomycete cytochrome C domain-containing protein [Planctomycetota bacterium]|nr:PSD1 and planctomycete cytochrome C domain-containing protein [Planctomycetota bacterium]